MDRNPPRASVRYPLRDTEPPSSCPCSPDTHACAFASRAGKRRGDRESRFFRRFTPRKRSVRAAAAWQQRVETLLGNLLGTRVTGVRRLAANGLREVSRDRPRSVIVGRSAKSHPRTAGRGTFHRDRLEAWKPPVGHPFTLPRRLSLRMTRRLELGFAKIRLLRISHRFQAGTQDGRAPFVSSPTPGLDDQACGSDSSSALRRTACLTKQPGD